MLKGIAQLTAKPLLSNPPLERAAWGCRHPKSVHKERIEENFDIWDFTLTGEEMETISSRYGVSGNCCKAFRP